MALAGIKDGERELQTAQMTEAFSDRPTTVARTTWRFSDAGKWIVFVLPGRGRTAFALSPR